MSTKSLNIAPVFIMLMMVVQVDAQTEHPRWMMGMGIGFASRTDFSGWPDYKKYHSWGGRFVPETGVFLTKKLLFGLRWEYNFAKSNFTAYHSVHGGGYFFRHFLPSIQLDKKISLFKKQRNIEILPFLEAEHLSYNGYYDETGFVKAGKCGAQEISLHFGGRLKLSNGLYFVLYPGYAYNFSFSGGLIRNEGGFEYYFSTIKK